VVLFVTIFQIFKNQIYEEPKTSNIFLNYILFLCCFSEVDLAGVLASMCEKSVVGIVLIGCLFVCLVM